MKSHLLRLFSGSFIYSSGGFLSRVITFLLLPLTTAYLTPEDYGIIGTLAIAAQFLTGLFTLGFGVSFNRCYWTVQDRSGLIWAAFATLLINITLWIFLFFLFSKQISWLLLGSQDYTYFVLLSLLSLGLNCSTLPFSTYLRIQERAFLATSLTVLEVVVTTMSMLFLVIAYDRHAQGVLEGSIIGQVFIFLTLLFIGLLEIKISFKWSYVKEMISIGYPYIFGLIGYFLMQCSSRYILQIYCNLDEVGLFFMGMNFARTIELAVGGFLSAWPPFFTSFLNNKEEGAKVFSKTLTYYVIGMSTLLVFYFTLAKPIVYLMVQPRYHEVWSIVGILAISFALWGAYSISTTGFIFCKKSLWQMATETGAGLAAILLGFLLIPHYHKHGAALATTLSFTLLLITSLTLNRKLFPIPYETKRITKTLLGLLCVAIISYLPHNNPWTFNLISILFFLIYLWLFCLTPDEKLRLLRAEKGLHPSSDS